MRRRARAPLDVMKRLLNVVREKRGGEQEENLWTL
jgi:hypothetical protein